MCCTVEHQCTCVPEKEILIRCHVCSQHISSSDYAHIDGHIDRAEDAICMQCHISIPTIEDWMGLCRSCQKDNERDKES